MKNKNVNKSSAKTVKDAGVDIGKAKLKRNDYEKKLRDSRVGEGFRHDDGRRCESWYQVCGEASAPVGFLRLDLGVHSGFSARALVWAG